MRCFKARDVSADGEGRSVLFFAMECTCPIRLLSRYLVMTNHIGHNELRGCLMSEGEFTIGSRRFMQHNSSLEFFLK
jgi:hypothetical protein